MTIITDDSADCGLHHSIRIPSWRDLADLGSEVDFFVEIC